MTKLRALATALLLSVSAGLFSAGAADAACMSNREGRQLIRQGVVIPFPEAVRRAGLRRREVLQFDLCEAGGGFVYRVQVLNKGGRVRSINIPAG